jgi:CubicO group peptidase (beta-lactamase class C family)
MTKKTAMNRREFLAITSTATAGLVFGCQKKQKEEVLVSDLDAFIEKRMAEVRIPGLSTCIIKNNRMAWSKSYGYADLEKQIKMTADHVENIGSISKTFVTTAIMQLWEKGKFKLDDAINDYLSFEVKHPQYPEKSITFNHLLTHTSSLADGGAYGQGYACGDPKDSLQDWHRAYFTPGMAHYHPDENFHSWGPGESRPLSESYCNVAFGLLAILVEKLSGQDFEEYCQSHIFKPLEMNNTSWYIKNVDVTTHAIPYTWVEGGKPRGPSWGGKPLGVIRETGPTWDSVIEPDGHAPNCFYNHPNFPDGFLRCSVNQLSHYIRCYLNKGVFSGQRILEEDTIKLLLQKRNLNVGLCWQEKQLNDGRIVWGHLGNDPGVNNLLMFDPETGTGTAILANTNMGKLGGVRTEIATRLFQEGESL